MGLEISVGLAAANNAPRIIARLRKERPFVDPYSRWPPKGSSRPGIEFSVGVPSGRWALLGVQQHEFAAHGRDWAPVQVIGLMSSGNRRSVRLDLSDDVGSPVGLTTVSLRLYFWQQSRVPLIGALSRSFYFDVQLTSQGGLVDVRPMGSDWLCRLGRAEHVIGAVQADAEALSQGRQRPAGIAWDSRDDDGRPGAE
jgi:hypothetical protein